MTALRRILWVTTEPPWVPDRGARIRDFELMTRVAETHHVTLLFTGNDAESAAAARAMSGTNLRVESFRPTQHPVAECIRWASRGYPFATWSWLNLAIWNRVSQLIATGEFDLLHVEHSFLAPLVDAVPKGSRTGTVVDLHNVAESQYETYRRMDRAWYHRLVEAARAVPMRGWEARWTARFDRCVTVSVRDAERLQATVPAPQPCVIPNGVDTRRLQPQAGSIDGGLLFVGNLGYRPNADAVRFLGRDILPLIRRDEPETELTVVGSGAPRDLHAASWPGVTIAGRVDDVTSSYRAARVAVVPLRASGGTPLKVLEAMALGRPVVATSLACAGLTVRAGEHVLVEDDAVRFAAAVVSLLRDPGRCEELAHAARTLVEREYSWDLCADRLLAVYQSIDPR